MSTELFPLTYQYSYEETINFRTIISEFEDGEEQRRNAWASPLRSFKLSFPALTYSSIETLWNFYIARKGAYESFYFDALHQPPVTNEVVAVGDATTTRFIAILDIPPLQSSTLTIVAATITGAASGMTISGTGITGTIIESSGTLDITFTTPPASITTIYANYKYYYLVRFQEDSLALTQFAYRCYQNELGLKEVRS